MLTGVDPPLSGAVVLRRARYSNTALAAAGNPRLGIF
jgi:hypothetical protein